MSKDYIYEGEGKFQTLVEGDYYRVSTITKVWGEKDNKLILENMPISYGLNIEERMNDKYLVIASIYWDAKDKEVKLDDVAFRSINTLDPGNSLKMDEYINCILFAKQAIIDVNENNQI